MDKTKEQKIKTLKIIMLISIVEMTLAVLVLIYPDFVMNMFSNNSTKMTPYLIAGMLFVGGTTMFYICKSALIKLNTK